MRVVVVEDDQDLRELLGHYLEDRGGEFCLYQDGRSAWTALASSLPDLLLLDWQLPGLSGEELCRRVRGLPGGQAVEIVVLTGAIGTGALHAALDAGADDYLRKPFDLDILDVRLTVAERHQADKVARRQAEDAQRGGEQTFQTVTDLIPDIVLRADARGHIEWRNRRWADYTGQSAAQSADSGWLAAVHPDDRASLIAARARALAQSTPLRHEHRIRSRDGAYRWFALRAEPCPDAHGHIQEWYAVVTDIHEERTSREQLRTSEERLRLVLQGAGLRWWSMDLATHAVIAASNADTPPVAAADAQPLLMYDYPEALARVLPEDQDRLGQAIQQAIAGQESVTAEFRVLASDGCVRWQALHGRVIAAEGNPGHLIGVTQDITARKEVEEALRQSEARYRQIVETTGDGVWLIDTEARTTFVNHQMAALLGYTVEEMLGTSMWQYVGAEERAQASQALARRWNNIPTQNDFRYQRKDGSPVWTNITATSLRDASGTVTGALAMVRDIMARRDTDEQLRLRTAAVEAASSGIVITDATLPDNPIIYANPAFTQLTGYPPAQVLGYNCRFLQGPETDRQAVALLRQGIAEGSPVTVPLLNYRQDDTPFWQELAVSPVADSTGRITHFIGIQTDITARKEAEEALRRSERYFHALLENTADVVVVLSGTGAVLYESPSMERLFGHRLQDRLSRSFQELIHPDDQSTVADAFAAILRRPAELVMVEFRLRHRDGTWRYFDAVSKNLLDDSAVGGVVVNGRDTTTRKQAEQALRHSEQRLQRSEQVQRAVAQLTLLATSRLDAESILGELCQAAAAVFGLANTTIWLLDEPAVLRLAATMGTELSVGLRLPVDAPAFAAGQAVRERRTCLVTWSGAVPPGPPELREVRVGVTRQVVLATPLRLGEEILGALAVLAPPEDEAQQEISEGAEQVAGALASALYNSRLYAREQEVATRLRAIDAWRTDFLRVVAHELRTPLGHVLGFSDLLGGQSDKLTTRGQRYLANVQQAAGRLQHLVERSLALLRVSSEEAALSREPLLVADLIASARARGQARAETLGVTLAQEGPPPGLMVQGESTLLAEALDILLDNALNVTPPQGRITLTAIVDAEQVAIGVQDTGPGVPPERRATLLSGLREDALTRQQGGTGMGLLLVRRIAEAHGGELRLEIPDQGARFVLILPPLIREPE